MTTKPESKKIELETGINKGGRNEMPKRERPDPLSGWESKIDSKKMEKIDVSDLSQFQKNEIFNLVSKFRISNGLGLTIPALQDRFYQSSKLNFNSFINNQNEKDGKEK